MALMVNPSYVDDAVEHMEEIVEDYIALWKVPPRPRVVFQEAREWSWRAPGAAARKKKVEAALEEERAAWEVERSALTAQMEGALAAGSGGGDG